MTLNGGEIILGIISLSGVGGRLKVVGGYEFSCS